MRMENHGSGKGTCVEDVHIVACLGSSTSSKDVNLVSDCTCAMAYKRVLLSFCHYFRYQISGKVLLRSLPQRSGELSKHKNLQTHECDQIIHNLSLPASK
jgi:hypothetical protein